MPEVESWRQNLWDERLAQKPGIPIDRLNLSFSLYYRLRNWGIDTIEELENLTIARFLEMKLTKPLKKEFLEKIETINQVKLENWARIKAEQSSLATDVHDISAKQKFYVALFQAQKLSVNSLQLLRQLKETREVDTNTQRCVTL